MTSIGGQSAPPSLKPNCQQNAGGGEAAYRGAVRPPFIEAPRLSRIRDTLTSYRGAVRPPFIEAQMRTDSCPL